VLRVFILLINISLKVRTNFFKLEIKETYKKKLGEVPQQGDNERTLITFNKGSEWNVIKPPLRNANNQATTCNIVCLKNFFLHSFPPIVTGVTILYHDVV